MTLGELRQMMHPDSGLLWSPWFRWVDFSGWQREGHPEEARPGREGPCCCCALLPTQQSLHNLHAQQPKQRTLPPPLLQDYRRELSGGVVAGLGGDTDYRQARRRGHHPQNHGLRPALSCGLACPCCAPPMSAECSSAAAAQPSFHPCPLALLRTEFSRGQMLQASLHNRMQDAGAGIMKSQVGKNGGGQLWCWQGHSGLLPLNRRQSGRAVDRQGRAWQSGLRTRRVG